MTFPVQFLTRFAIPMLVAAFMLEGNGPEQVALYDKILIESDRTLSSANEEGEGPTESYDYIIIGAGSAGSVLTKRLTESGTETVLLLEAGGDPNPISETVMFQGFLGQSDMWLGYMSVEQEIACKIRSKACGFPRGKALGGSSSVNGLVYNRCNAKDYDNWANFTNDPTWAFASVVDAFKAVENYHGFYEDNPGPNHGTEGEMYVGKMEFLPAVDVLFEAVAEKGMEIGDFNSGLFPTGFSKIDYNLKEGLRYSTYHAFIEPILDRANLQIYRYATATRVHIDDEKRIMGVTYRRHGKTKYVSANKEVIISAGVIDTPKLLMLSGIGPADHLAELGIELELDLPAVGNYLQEHIATRLPPIAVNKTFGPIDYLTEDTVNQYITNGSGPLEGVLYWGDYAPQIAMGYFPSKTYNDPTWPDLHAYVHQYVYFPVEGGPEEQVFIPDLELVRTDQYGTIRLASSNPEDWPLIDPKFFENPQDIERLVEGTEFLVDLFFNSTTFQALGVKWSDSRYIVEECEGIPFATTEYWRCYVVYYSATALHPTSTCRMGPNSTVAVVDSRLRVFGTTGLRIIDSSIMPFVPNGNTNFPSIMIGEMGSRFILGQIE